MESNILNKLPTIEDVGFSGKNVLVRGDFNVEDADNPRVDSIRNIINLLKSKNTARIKIIGHTETKYDLAFILRNDYPDVEFDDKLRDNPGEKENSIDFARGLAEGFDVYINEAFSVSHRKHASVVALPKAIKQDGGEICIGPRFAAELENLGKVFDPSASSGQAPKRPVIMVISGVKEDKLTYLEAFAEFADKILIGGRLPLLTQNSKFKTQNYNSKVKIANLIQDNEDITIHSIEMFEEEIKNAGTIVVSGPVGKFEDEGHRLGTERVFRAVINNTNAFKVAGGGDTEQAISLLELRGQFDWISVGGGAMLEFLAKGTLPGIEALLDI